MSVERWAEKDALRVVRRWLVYINRGELPPEEERTYLKAAAMFLLLNAQLEEESAMHLRYMVQALELGWPA